MCLLMENVPIVQVVWVLLPSDRAPFDSFLVVKLMGLLKDPLEPVRWLVCVAASLAIDL